MSIARIVGLLVLVTMLVVSDQASKLWVLDNPTLSAQSCFERRYCGYIELSPILDFRMVWNWGISFGLFQSEGVMRWVLSGFVCVVTLSFLVWMIRTPILVLSLALAFIIAGAIGNLIDRVQYGAVVDFMSLHDIGFKYVFNVADVWVNIGAALLFLEFFILAKRRANA